MVTELVNSAPGRSGEERLGDLAALRAFIERFGISGTRQLTNGDVRALHVLRARLSVPFVAASVAEHTTAINAILREFGAVPQLTAHDELPLHLHYFAEDAPLIERLGASGAAALAVVLAAGEHTRLRLCAHPECARVFIDLSRNRSRRYCDDRTCGNRLHVAAYRARRRS